MKSKHFLRAVLLFSIFMSCSKIMEHSPSNQNHGNEHPLTSSGLKPQLGGLAVRSLSLAQSYPDSFLRITNALIVNINWSQLQPDSFHEAIVNNAIDSAITYAQGLAASKSISMYVKIRVFTGVYSPNWVLNDTTYGGGSKAINFYNPDITWTPGDTSRLPIFWSTGYLKAFGDLIHKLSDKYDADTTVREFTASPGSITTVEPYLIKCGENSSITSGSPYYNNCVGLFNAGYTYQKHIAANERGVDTLEAYWPTTRVSMAFGPYEILTQSGSNYTLDQDVDTGETFINYFHTATGAKGVLGNNGLRDAATSSEGTNWMYPNGSSYLIYVFMDNKHPRGGIYFQTAANAKMGNFWNTLDTGIVHDAGMIEAPSLKSGLSGNLGSIPLTVANLHPYDSTLEAQAK
jgi:hypothetical protein